MSIEEVHTPGVPIKLWTNLDEVEPQALAQLGNIATLPWAFHHVAAMPDVHLGIGATVGSVVALRGAVVPAAVGVDIGCGMGAVRTSLGAADLPDSLSSLRSSVEERIPVGFSQHSSPVDLFEEGALQFARFGTLHPRVQSLLGKASCQLGTLGGGNHFIELCLDETDRVWMVLHSGSRNIGKCLAEIHMAIAKKLTHNADLPDRALAAFLAGTPEMEAYMNDLVWAQEYAFLNRRTMLGLYAQSMIEHFPGVHFERPILCHHNYVSQETHFGEDVVVTRKGAIRARTDDWGIIPGSMGAKTYIVRGLGNPESFESASHGAGRRMSRTAARRMFTVDDLRSQTAGVECRKDEGVLDEIPAAYKNIDRVMENQRDLVQVVHKLRQVMCVKG